MKLNLRKATRTATSMAAVLCTLLLLSGVTLPGTALTAQAAVKSISSLAFSGIATKDYTGEEVVQSPTIKDGTRTLKKGTDYTLSYQNNKEIGIATVTIKGKGGYSGSVSESFQIIPPKMQDLTAKSLMTGTAEFAWASDYEQVLSGYQVYYASSKSGKYTKLATVNTNYYKAKLTGGKAYYAKVRAYTKVGSKVYYGKYSEVVKVTVSEEQSTINIIDSGRAYGNYIKSTDIPKEIISQMKYVYPNGILTGLSIQYLDKSTNNGRWVDFFEEVTKDNNPVMGKNDYVGMFRFEIISKDPIDTVQQHYEDMKPDKHSEWYGNNMNNPVLSYNRTGGTGVYSLTLFKNPAVDSDGWIQEYFDMKEDGYLTTISGVSEWIPN